MPFFLALWVAVISLTTFSAFAWDKRAARRGGRRLPEARLLWLAVLGGMPGAKLAQSFLRHKTRKQPFAGRLNLILAMQIAVGVVVGVLWLRFGAL